MSTPPAPFLGCRQARELCSAEIDGELALGEQARLMAHLEGCSACRHARGRLRWAVATVRSSRGRLPGAAAARALIDAARSRRSPALILAVLMHFGGAARGQDRQQDPGSPIPTPLRVESADLARSRIEHAVLGAVQVRNISLTPQSGRVRLIVDVEGKPQEGEWLKVAAVDPGRWVTLNPRLPQTPEFKAWRLEIELEGGEKYRYEADDPSAPARLVNPAGHAELPLPTPDPQVLRAGVHAAWASGGFLVRVQVTGDQDLAKALDDGQLTVRARSEGRELGRTRKKLDKALLRRDARKVEWAEAPSGFAAWDPTTSSVVLQVFRAEYPEELAIELDVELTLAGKRRWSFEQLGPPWRNDPVPPPDTTSGKAGGKPGKGERR